MTPKNAKHSSKRRKQEEKGEGEQESPHHFKSTKHLHYGRDGGGEGRPLVNFLKMKEGEGGRAGGNTLPFLKATDTTSIRGGEVLGFKRKILGEFTTKNCILVNYYSK